MGSVASKNNVTQLILTDLFQGPEVQRVCFVLFLPMYLATVVGSGLIVLTVNVSKSLHFPVYFFLSYLSLMEISYSSTVVPKFITDLLTQIKIISMEGCLAQIFFFHFFGVTEILLLTVMVYDCYVAICEPLHYTTVMSHPVCHLLVAGPWIGGVIHSMVQILVTVQSPFGGPNVIDHYFYDLHLLFKVAYTDTFVEGVTVLTNSGLISVTSILMLVSSYVIILVNLRSHSAEGRCKALSTCASHITVVILFSGPAIFLYTRPSSTFTKDKLVVIFCVIIIPMLNPIIYTFRNTEVKNNTRRLWGKKGNAGHGPKPNCLLYFSPTGKVTPCFSLVNCPDSMENNVTEFILTGLSQNEEVQQLCFFLFLLFYIILMAGNFLIIMTIQRSPNLNSPTYFLISFLSFVDICYSSVTAPKLIIDFPAKVKSISFVGCMIQLFYVHLFGCTDIFILTVMAYDRYVAICKPLRYTTIMDWKVCSMLVLTCWLGGFVHSFIQAILTVQLPFCGSNLIDHYFCDVHPLLKLACADTYVVGLIVVANSGIISLSCFVILVGSYTVILLSFKTRSSEGRREALSTCASHITVVILFFVPCIFIHLRPSTTFTEDKMVAVFYTIITPMLNPLIYTLRNTEVKNAMKRLWIKKLLGKNRKDPDVKPDGIGTA
ncbi:uncharacterized protein ACIGJ3_012026 [Trichechus inunguis]